MNAFFVRILTSDLTKFVASGTRRLLFSIKLILIYINLFLHGVSIFRAAVGK